MEFGLLEGVGNQPDPERGRKLSMGQLPTETSPGMILQVPTNSEAWLLMPKQELPVSKKSPIGPTERTPKPEYLLALATSLGVRW